MMSPLQVNCFRFSLGYILRSIQSLATRLSSFTLARLQSPQIMKAPRIAAALGLAGLSIASSCNNNCGRQVAGTGAERSLAPTSYADRSSACSAYLTTYITVTPA
jgi:hypothetical protein